MKEITTIISLFLVVQLLGLCIGGIMSSPSNMEDFSSLNVAPSKDSGDLFNSAYFLVAVILGAVFLIFMIKNYRGVFLFKALETLIVFFASFIVFLAFLYQFSGFLASINPVLGLAELWAFLGAVALAVLKYRMPNLKNIVAVISSAGVGALFGFSLNLIPAILFIIGLSIYDVVAVFYTKHMLTMAREMSKRSMSFSVSVESIEKRKATPDEKKKMQEEAEAKHKQEIKELKASGRGAVPKAYAKIEPPKEYIEEKRHLELGTGDMAIPLMLSVSVLRFGGPALALAVVFGACVGLYFTLNYVFSKRTFLPALPPISAGALIALAIAWSAQSFF